MQGASFPEALPALAPRLQAPSVPAWLSQCSALSSELDPCAGAALAPFLSCALVLGEAVSAECAQHARSKRVTEGGGVSTGHGTGPSRWEGGEFASSHLAKPFPHVEEQLCVRTVGTLLIW